MKIGMLLAVLIYELCLILGIGLFLQKRNAAHRDREGEFALAGKSLPLSKVAITLALTVLGAPHIMGMWEMTWHMGAVTIWFCLAHVFLLVFVCLTTGRWVRRMGISSVSEIFEQFFGKGVRLMISCVMVGMMFGFMTIEAQGSGIIFAAMTGWDIKYGCAVGVLFGAGLVILAGMRELGLVNLINAGVMYLAVILATLFLALKLPGGNYHSVADFYINSKQAAMLSIYGPPALMVNFVLSTLVAVIFCVGFSQVMLQPAMAADSEATVKKAMWIAAPLNGLWGAFMVTIGLTAKSLPEFQALGPKLAAPALLVTYLPPWLSTLLLAAFLSALIGNFASVALGCSTVLTFDIYRPLYRPDAAERQMARMARILIVIMAIAAMGVATFLPPILPALNWLFSWSIPIFWIAMFGFFWKRSSQAALLTLLSAWGTNSLWSFSPLPSLLHLPDSMNIYATLAVTLLVGILANLAFPGRPAYFKSDEYLALNANIHPQPGPGFDPGLAS
ncbi:MAG: sodium:solute symporter [Candidatus Sericytochromatia bacterium]